MATLAEALHIALDHHLAGRSEEASALYRRIIEVAPDVANAHHLLGLLLSQGGDLDRGIAHLTRAVVLAPNQEEFSVNLAKALVAAGRPAAIGALGRARRLVPLNAEIPAYLAPLAADAGQGAVALAAARHLTLLQPDLADAWGRRGTGAHEQKSESEATAALRRRAILRGDDADCWRSAGAAWRNAGAHDRAAACFRTALTLAPDDVATLSTAANTIKDLGDVPRSLPLHDRAVRLAAATPALQPTLRWNQAIAQLLAGDFAAGWDAWESRWTARGFPTQPRHQHLPLWQGEDIRGQTILLYEEQGRGDAIQFARYAPLVAARGARVVLEVGADLAALMGTLDGVDGVDGVGAGQITVVTVGAPLPACTYRCPLMSLPRAFATTLETIPAAVPYLRANPLRTAHWRARRDPADGVAVGLIWGGNPAYSGDRWRSPGLAPLLPLCRLPGVTVYGLQVGPARAALANMPAAPLVDWGQDVPDFAEAAARMAALDVVVSSCTAGLHLAGALGLPTCGLLSYVADWRWLTARSDSPWYPTLRLFRQPAPGDWASIVSSVTQSLRP